MDTTLKAKWTAALRSGDYEQNYGSLKTWSGFCCIGVLGDIQGIDWSNFIGSKHTCSLPVGLNAGTTLEQRQLLENMNDGTGIFYNKENSTNQHQTFAQIADYIDANL